MAGEAGVPFFSITGSEFVEMFVGVGAARVRDLFEQARAEGARPSSSSTSSTRSAARAALGGCGGHDEKEQTLNQLLVELDGFDSAQPAWCCWPPPTGRRSSTRRCCAPAASTARCWSTGRTRRAGVADPGGACAARSKLAPDVDLEQVAALTPGFTGADLANLVNEAALLATRRGAEAVTHGRLQRRRSSASSPAWRSATACSTRQEREIVAYHEMGHALVALALPGTDPVHKVSIIPRGVGALGYTIQRPTEDRFLMTREELENKMAVLLGGRAAEQLVFGHLSTGAADDLAKVTDIARGMVTRYGMSEKLGHVAYENDGRGSFRARTSRSARASATTPRRPRRRSTTRSAPSWTPCWSARSPCCASGATCWNAAPGGCWRRRRSTRRSS